jgi:hypothetical protein
VAADIDSMDAPGPSRRRRTSPVLVLAGLWTLVVTLGTTGAFLLVALIGATFNCEDGCRPGSPWAPGASGSVIELWGLAVPAALAACGLVWAVATGRRRASLTAWAGVTGLLVAWCVFTGASSVSIDFSGTNSHWMWLAGLLVASGGGLVGVGVAFVESTPGGGVTPRFLDPPAAPGDNPGDAE